MGEEVVRFLSAPSSSSNQDTLVLDCTLGMGGHSELLLQANPHIKIFGIDRDATALEQAQKRLAPYTGRVTLSQGSFSDCESLVGDRAGTFTGVLADLGISSVQLDDPDRGFSFMNNGPLDMRMNQLQPLSAAVVVNEYSVKALERAFKKGGLGSESRALAFAIERNRPIADTKTLAALIEKTLLPIMRRRQAKADGQKRHHPATVAFQAIRIEVNDELGVLERFLEAAPRLLADHGRMAIICFHSLEDRAVARAMRKWERGEDVPRGLRAAHNPTTLGKLLTKHAVTPSEQEILENPRARSARLRVFERIKISGAALQ